MSERAPSRMAENTALADIQIAHNQALSQALQEHEINQSHSAALVDNAAFDRSRSIEAKKVSPEVALLNDKAEFEIYGSRGRTYEDPVSGEVIATPERPIKGKLEEILTNRKYGRTKAEREETARDYEREMNDLLGDGFELCQVKLIQDLRDNDIDNFEERVSKLVLAGMNDAEAEAKIDADHDKKDLARQKFILENGVFTEDEYKSLIKPKETKVAEPSSDELAHDLARYAHAIKKVRDNGLNTDTQKDDVAKLSEKMNQIFNAWASKKGLDVEDKQGAYNHLLEMTEASAADYDLPDSDPATIVEAPKKKTLRDKLRNRKNAIMLLPATALGRVGERIRGDGTPEQKAKRGRGLLILGAAAVVGAGLIWANDKYKWGIDINPFDGDGFDLNPFNNHNTRHSNVTGIVDTFTPGHRGGSGAAHEAAKTFPIEQGHGYTQEIRDAFPGHTPSQYLSAHEQAVRQFGPDYLKGVSKYTSGSELRLDSPGSGSWVPGAEDYLKKLLEK